MRLGVGIPGGFDQVARAVDVDGFQVGTTPLRFTAGEVIDDFDAAQGSPDTAHIREAGHRSFDRDAARQAGRFKGGLQEDAHLVTGFHQLAGERTPDETGAAGEENLHGLDYS